MPDRATTGLLVTAQGCPPLLIDTCGGFELPRQLARIDVALADIRNVIVTHRHLDHAGGMQALLLANMPLEIYANADTHAGIATMTQGCFPEWVPHRDICRHTVAAGATHDIGGFMVTFFEAVHRVATLAVRVEHGGLVFAFSADTLPCDNVIACAAAADLFVCDAICATTDGEHATRRARDLMHPTALEAATMAAQAGAGSLVLTHIGRFGDPEGIRKEAAATFGGPVTIAHDGATFTI